MTDEPITFRAGLHSLDSAGANFKFQSGGEHLTVSMDPDRFRTLGRPGWIQVTVTAIGGES